MAVPPLTVRELADELNVDPKAIRAWMRRQNWRHPVEARRSWLLNDEQNEFEWRSRYWTFLLRLHPDRPSSTLQAQPGPWVGPSHWENVKTAFGDTRARRLRVSEILRLMSFLDDYVIEGSRADVQRQLGNAVPVELGKVVIRPVVEQLGHSTASRADRSLLFA